MTTTESGDRPRTRHHQDQALRASSAAAGARQARPPSLEEQRHQQRQPTSSAAAQLNRLQQQSTNNSEAVRGDPLQEWMQERQQVFRDFERSFQPYPPPLQFGSNFDGGSFGFPSIPQLSPLPQLSVLPFDDDLQLYPPASNMLSSRDNPSDLSPKARVTYDEGKFQVDFDVKDYRPEELSIKTEGDVLVVLAKHETKAENGASFVSKQFEQRFTLPSGVAPESITSSLAKDGTLTVSAPREVHRTAELSGFRRLSPPSAAGHGSHGITSTGAVYAHSNPEQEEGLPHPKVKYDEDKFQISLDCQHYKPEELDVKVEGSSIIIQAKQELKEAGGVRTRVFEQKFTLPSGVRAEKVSSSFGKDGVLTITAPRQAQPAVSHVQQQPYSSVEQRMDRVLSPSNWEDTFQKSSPLTSSTSSRDHLKHSSIFDRDPSFLTALADSNGSSSGGISKVQLDDDTYKILVNVQDFKPEELVIKTVGNTVHFEAKHEEKTSDGHAFTSRNVSQSFTLPRGVDPELVSSALSKDGVLTISAPLPPALKLQQQGERLVPIKHR